MPPLAWLGVAAGLLVLIALVLVPWIRGRLARAEREATIAVGGEVVLGGTATFVGIESAGRRQLRGTGHLAVGREEVVFVMIAPHRVVRIPRGAIGVVDTPRSHLGRSPGRPLLRIAFTGADGAADSVAFDVGGSPGPWREALATG